MSDRASRRKAIRVALAEEQRGVEEISNLQWYMLRGQGAVYFALHVPRQIERDEFLSLVNLVLDGLPRLTGTYTTEADVFTLLERDEVLSNCRYGRSPDISKDWQSFLAGLPDLGRRLDGRVFEATCVVSKSESESLIMFAALHAAIEGADVENLLRSSAVNSANPARDEKLSLIHI